MPIPASRGASFAPPGPEDFSLYLERLRSLGHALRRSAAPAVLGYLLIRALAILATFLWAKSKNLPILQLLGNRYDSIWYLRIIRHGYDTGIDPHSSLAFFPLYPMLSRLVTDVSPVGPMGAALLVSWAAGLAAAWGIYRVGAHLHSRRVGTALALLWAVVPHAIVGQMAYTEGLFTALAAWTLYALLSEKWLTAATLCFFAGLTRPTAAALIAAVCLASLVAIIRRQGSWRPWISLLVSPWGWAGYLLWVAQRTHRLGGWFIIEHDGWKSGWDGGGFTLSFTIHQVLGVASPLDFIVVAAVLLVAVTLFVISIIDRQPWPLLVYSTITLLTTVGGFNYYNSKARFLVPAFTLLIPAAVSLARMKTTKSVIVFSALGLVSVYFGGYLLLVWNFSP